MEKNKRFQTIQSSNNKILKSKYLTTQNNSRTKNNSTGNKIMLTDLCPQQKVKIGELIKTLESRKQQNQQLNEQISEWKTNFIILEKAKLQLENSIQSKQVQINKGKDELYKEQKYRIEKDIEIEQLRLQIQLLMKQSREKDQQFSKLKSQKQKKTVDEQVQTREKKKRTKDRQIQVEILKTNKHNYFGQNQTVNVRELNSQFNSKSFDRIMNNQHPKISNSDKKSKESYTAIFGKQQSSRSNINENTFRGNQFHNLNKMMDEKSSQNKHMRGASQFSQNNDFYFGSQQPPEQYQQRRQFSEINQNQQNHQDSKNRNDQGQIQIFDTQNDDDQFELLAKKWLELKQKNIQQHQKLAQQQMSEQWVINNHQVQAISQPKHHKKQNQRHKQQQQQRQERKSRMNQEQIDGLIDQEQLNRALKGRDFSASRVLNNSKSRKHISENSDRKSMANSHTSYTNSRYSGNQASQYGRKQIIKLQRSNKNNASSQATANNNKRQPNFYSDDLLDLVEQMNQ